MSTPSHLDSPPFHPKGNLTSNSSERLAWARDYLTEKGFWTDFASSTDWRLSCMFRDNASVQVDSVIGSAVGALALKGAVSEVHALCLCLSEKSCHDTVHSVLQSQHYGVFEELFYLVPPHRHEMCLRFAATNKVDTVLDFLLPRVTAEAFSKEALGACLSNGNHYAGPKILEKLDPLEILRERGQDQKCLALVDQWWSENLKRGRMLPPTSSRSFAFWSKRLPEVRTILKAASLDKAMGSLPPSAARRPRL